MTEGERDFYESWQLAVACERERVCLRGALLWLVLLLEHLSAHDHTAYAALLTAPIGNGLRNLARQHGINPPAEISTMSLCAPLLGVLRQESARAIASDAAA